MAPLSSAPDLSPAGAWPPAMHAEKTLSPTPPSSCDQEPSWPEPDAKSCADDGKDALAEQPGGGSAEALDDIGDAKQRALIARTPLLRWLYRRAHAWKVERIGITPLPDTERTGTRWWAPAFIFFSADFNLLGFSSGTLAATYGLGMYGALFTILGFSALCSLPPAVICTFGPKLGLRQMVQSRYSWGYVPVMLIGLCAAASSMGYCILDAVLGGDTLSSVTTHHSLTPVVGIVIICVITLVISFAGIGLISWVERLIWIPVLVPFITLIAMAGTGPEGLHIPPGPDPSTASGVLSMGSVIAGFYLSYSTGVSDVSHYLRPDTPTWKLFSATWAGFFFGGAPMLMLGAAFAVSAQDIPAWQDALNVSNGSLFELIMGNNPDASTATRGWSKFCIVLLALSVIPNMAITFYSFGLNLQTILPALTSLPRFVWMVLATAIVLPLGIVVSLNSAYYSTLSNFTSVLGYWSALYVAPVLLEWFVIRRGQARRYDRQAWNDWRRLPLGAAALGSAAIALAVLIPSIDQLWFQGPIAKHHTGDIAFETGLAATALLYVPLRLVELHFWGH